jgi:hypothetical protein
MAARDSSHDYTNDISVVPDFTSTLSIYGVPGGARCALADELTCPGPQLASLPQGSISSGKIGSDVDGLCSLTGSPRMEPENLACELLSGADRVPHV